MKNVDIDGNVLLPSGKKRKFTDALIEGVYTDLEASKKLFELYPYWVFCQNELYVFDNSTGMYSNTKTSYINIITQHTDFLHIMVFLEKRGWTKSNTKSYGNSACHFDKIIPIIKTLNMNNDWLKQSDSSSLGKILFENGYYDFHK